MRCESVVVGCVCFFLAERAGLRCVVATSSAYLPLAPNEFFMGDAKVPNSLLFKDSPGLDEENRFAAPRTVRRREREKGFGVRTCVGACVRACMVVCVLGTGAGGARVCACVLQF